MFIADSKVEYPSGCGFAVSNSYLGGHRGSEMLSAMLIVQSREGSLLEGFCSKIRRARDPPAHHRQPARVHRQRHPAQQLHQVQCSSQTPRLNTQVGVGLLSAIAN
jgi:hypothetical protein